MAFSDTEKLSVFKQMMMNAVEQGTEWDTFKDEFAAMSDDFKEETIGLLDDEIDRADARKVKWSTYKANAQLLKEEIEEL